MSTLWKYLNHAAFYGYAWFLVLIGGGLGLFVPTWGPLKFEVYADVIFRLPLDPQTMASTLNQYRFMKSTEFGFGLFALLFHDEIYTQRKFNRFFLGIVFLGATMRALSMLADGMPRTAYLLLFGLETMVGLIVLHHSRKTLQA
ncbi:DUF4345 family protein [Polyangium sp. y55x31]|uniref:DUF4345 family protein n=1 Tax=Polyangium sp. y55x31 TaxID=3042688 RepID=UPI00248267D9|nr:DUF4345 family protein [Polyangium sp. y55x31]MDI1478821.1 DUF4345 family protein [Polyangium sp. y55x31]